VVSFLARARRVLVRVVLGRPSLVEGVRVEESAGEEVWGVPRVGAARSPAGMPAPNCAAPYALPSIR